MMDIIGKLDWKKISIFAGGVLFGTAGIKLLASKDARKVYTNCTAAALRAKECVMQTVTTVQENAEDILAQLGISPSSAIQMFYSKIVLTRGMPFELRLPYPKPTAIGGMTREELDAELEKGWESMQNERLYSAEEVDKELAEEFGI